MKPSIYLNNPRGNKYIASCPRWPHIDAEHKKPHKAVKILIATLINQGLIDDEGHFV